MGILEDCKASLIDVLSHGDRLQSQFIAHSPRDLGEHVCFMPGSINRLCLRVVRLCHITDLRLVSRLGDVGKDKSQFLSHQDARSPSEDYHHRLAMTKESPRSFTSYVLHPGSKTLEGRKGRRFLSACKQPDGPTLRRWSLAAVSSMGCWAEAQTALGKGCRRRLAQSSLVWPRFSLSPAFARRYWWLTL